VNITLTAILALVLSLGANLYQWRDYAVAVEKIRGDQKTAVQAAEAKAQKAARAVEAEQAARADAVAQSYEQGKTDAQATADRVAADLDAGDLRLRDIWQSAATRCLSNLGDATGQLDAARRDREASASRIVLAAAEADNQIAGLQAFIRAERKPPGAAH
jgi:hypothetical protein